MFEYMAPTDENGGCCKNQLWYEELASVSATVGLEGPRMYINILLIPYWPRMLINIFWHPLGATQYGRPIWRTGSIFSCNKGLWDCLPTKPITTKQQSVFWLVSQSRRTSAIFIGTCRWISLVAVVVCHTGVLIVSN